MRNSDSAVSDCVRERGESDSRRPATDHVSRVTYRLTNIGPVKEASLKLGRLTVIAGRNNTGKTYILYSLYGFLKTWRHRFALARTIKPLVRELQDSGRASVPFAPDSILKQRRSLVERLSKEFSTDLPRLFSSRRKRFQESSFAVELDRATGKSIPAPVMLDSAGIRISIMHDGADLIVGIEESDRRRRADLTQSEILRAYQLFLLGDLFPDPFILSAERFGISLFYRELNFTKNQLVDLLQKLGDDENRRSMTPLLVMDRSTSRYALPIKDNIQFTRSIPDMREDVSALADEGLPNRIKNLIDGHHENASEEIRFTSKARGKGRNFNIPLHLASSSARGLSGLCFFLRHVAGKGQMLIIDGPESHLDTKNQVLFARLLASSVKAGLRVLISTHSDYLVKELNNLIMLSRDFPEKNDLAKKLGYRLDEALAPNAVRAYVAEENSLTQCEIGPFGIEMPMFDATIDQINEAAIELSSRMIDDQTKDDFAS